MERRRHSIRQRTQMGAVLYSEDLRLSPFQDVNVMIEDHSDRGIGFTCGYPLRIGQQLSLRTEDGRQRQIVMRWGEINRQGFRFGAEYC